MSGEPCLFLGKAGFLLLHPTNAGSLRFQSHGPYWANELESANRV